MKILSDNFDVANSEGNQKVIFKLDKNCGEVEMRNGETHHHREMKFRLHKIPITNLLIKEVDSKQNYKDKVIVYGNAIQKFFPKKTNQKKEG